MRIKIIYILFGICAFTIFMGYISNPSELLNLLLTIPAVVIAITFHEYAHAYSAYKLGDDTAKLQGRLTLNPLKHIDPIGIITLIFFKFGWGKPVQVDYRNFNRNISASKAEAIVSIAGPLMNLFLAILFSIITVVIIKFNVISMLSARAIDTIMIILTRIVWVNIGLGIFNLIPLPPLDGAKVLNHILPYNARIWFNKNEQIFYIIFLVIWLTRIAGNIIAPAIEELYLLIFKFIAMIFGISI